MNVEQRWQGGRHVFVPPTDRFDPRRFDIAPIMRDTEAKRFVLGHHYSGTYPAARRRYGLYAGGDLVGVAVFSHPCSNEVLTSVFPGVATDSLELGRFVLLPAAKFNAETWFLARCFEHLRTDGFRGVVSFSDPVPRQTSDGETVFGGHIGTIYQAHNAVYLGRGTARTLRLLPDGRTFSARAIQKIRAGERGWEYAARELIAAGANPVDGDRREWLAREMPRITRPLRHEGNHKYAWAIDKKSRRALPPSLPYPKAA